MSVQCHWVALREPGNIGAINYAIPGDFHLMSVAFWKLSDLHLEKSWNTDWPTIKAGSSAAHDPTVNVRSFSSFFSRNFAQSHGNHTGLEKLEDPLSLILDDPPSLKSTIHE